MEFANRKDIPVPFAVLGRNLNAPADADDILSREPGGRGSQERLDVRAGGGGECDWDNRNRRSGVPRAGEGVRLISSGVGHTATRLLSIA